ncbi:MAG: hypothetical protein ACE5FN_03405 [Leptospirillia bacterium]
MHIAADNVKITPLPQQPVGTVTSLYLTAAADAACNSGVLLYRSDPKAGFNRRTGRRFRIVPDGRGRWYHLGTYWSNIAPHGEFMLITNCPAASRVTLERLEISRDRVAETYLKRYRAERASGDPA